jgi:hypothetical protein
MDDLFHDARIDRALIDTTIWKIQGNFITIRTHWTITRRKEGILRKPKCLARVELNYLGEKFVYFITKKCFNTKLEIYKSSAAINISTTLHVMKNSKWGVDLKMSQGHPPETECEEAGWEDLAVAPAKRSHVTEIEAATEID